MKISYLKVDNFMLFDSLDISWSSNINIISGENSTGKSTLLKLMYSILKPVSSTRASAMTQDQVEAAIVEKRQGNCRPDEGKIGRLVSRKQGSNRTDIEIVLERN